MSSASLELSAAAAPMEKYCKVLDCYRNAVLLQLKVLKIKLHYFLTGKILNYVTDKIRD